MATDATFKSFERELIHRVGIFERNLAALKSPGYDEQSLRQEFLDPFFAALGWDMENKNGLIPTHREVIVERRTVKGRADYLFQPERKARFVCEAKKPAEELHGDHAMQAKGYAWTIGVHLALLSDFEELKIYVVIGKPDKREPDEGLWRSYHFKEYVAKAQELWDLLARDNVVGGSVEDALKSLPKKLRPARTKNFDEEFLEFLDANRRTLASDLIRHNDRDDLLEGTKLNEAVQCILDRLLFIRISEARGIDMGTKLQSLLETWEKKNEAGKNPSSMRDEPPAGWGGIGLAALRGSLWNSIVRQIRGLDRRPPSHVPFFNGNLFKHHFSEELVVGDVWLSEFLKSISEDESPYKFGYVAVEILGTIYERFLGKIVRPQGRGTTIEEKPEVRKAGGVYYTPRYIVEYIVEQTVGELLEGKKPEDTLKLRFLDPACGSGSFLLRVFERVCEHWQQWLVENPGKRNKQWCWMDSKANTLHLTLRAKRQILLETVHGVDIDPQAVEVTQLSLYLKLLEDETRETLQREQDLFGGDDPILPPLQDNIKNFNSVISSDLLDGELLADEAVRKMEAFHAADWSVQFEAIMKAGGFDAVVGNPPYVRPHNLEDETKKYFWQHYKTFTHKSDLYCCFMENSTRLLKTGGYFSYIVSHGWLRLNSFQELRRFVLENHRIKQLVEFPYNVFADAQVATGIFVFEKSTASQRQKVQIIGATQMAETASFKKVREIPQAAFEATFQNVFDTSISSETEAIKEKMRRGVSIGANFEICFGLKTGDDEKFLHKTKGSHPDDKPLLRGDDVKRYQTEYKGEYVWYVPSRMRLHRQTARPGEPRRFEQPKILVKDTSSDFAGTYDPDGFYVKDVLIVTPKGSIAHNYDLRFVTGVINSKALHFYYRTTFQTIHVQNEELASLPLPKIDFADKTDKSLHDKLVSLVDKMLMLMPKLHAAKTDAARKTLQNAVTKTDQDIDLLVFKLYGLTKAEIKIVENVEK